MMKYQGQEPNIEENIYFDFPSQGEESIMEWGAGSWLVKSFNHTQETESVSWTQNSQSLPTVLQLPHDTAAS